MTSTKSNRRGFIKKLTGTALGAAVGANALAAQKIEILKPISHQRKSYGPNDQVNIAVIGMGIMGFSNAFWSLQVPGVKLVAVCDLYTGRLERAREKFGKDLFVTKNYKEILDRKDIDAVIVATSDHWHDRISIEAMNKGKHVYCEKPMVHRLEEGADVIATQKKDR
jgi:predicted dehydrogenase